MCRSNGWAVRMGALVVALLWVAAASAQTPAKAHPEMKKLEFLVGDWNVHGKTLNTKGEVVREWRSKLETRKQMGGQMIVTVDLAADGSPGQHNWKFFNKVTAKLQEVNFDIAGNFEIREEVSVEGRLAFSMTDMFVGTDGVARDWRKLYTNITPKSYDVLIHYSTDRKEWTLAFIVHHTRV